MPDLARLSACKAIDFSSVTWGFLFHVLFMFIFDPEVIMLNIVVHMVMTLLSLPRDDGNHGMVVLPLIKGRLLFAGYF